MRSTNFEESCDFESVRLARFMLIVGKMISRVFTPGSELHCAGKCGMSFTADLLASSAKWNAPGCGWPWKAWTSWKWMKVKAGWIRDCALPPFFPCSVTVWYCVKDWYEIGWKWAPEHSVIKWVLISIWVSFVLPWLGCSGWMKQLRWVHYNLPRDEVAETAMGFERPLPQERSPWSWWQEWSLDISCLQNSGHWS